jgi:hypothetical protein
MEIKLSMREVHPPSRFLPGQKVKVIGYIEGYDLHRDGQQGIVSRSYGDYAGVSVKLDDGANLYFYDCELAPVPDLPPILLDLNEVMKQCHM